MFPCGVVRSPGQVLNSVMCCAKVTSPLYAKNYSAMKRVAAESSQACAEVREVLEGS